jgi:predicted ArsR family transcriptional regulator
MAIDPIKESSICLHPIRWKILNTLASGTPLYIDAIATEIKEERRLVSFHLVTLQENGYLESEFKVVKEPQSKGKAGRFFKITPKFAQTKAQLLEKLKS